MEKALKYKAAEAALERGDYNLCIDLLEDLTVKKKLSEEEIAKIKMLILTAQMGKGEDQKALNICRLLVNSRDPNIRQEAKQLLSILEAPTLPRPKNWSIEIPNIEISSSTKKNVTAIKKKKYFKQTTPTYPPTGDTKYPTVGFSVIVLIFLVVLTFLLSGCVQISNNFELKGPDKIKMVLTVKSKSSDLLPWQKEFAKSIKELTPDLKVKNSINNQTFESPPLRSEELNEMLNSIAKAASNSSGFKINSPSINVTEGNWILGVKQDILLTYDFSKLPKIPGLELSINILPLSNNTEFKANPINAKLNERSLYWPLDQSQFNQIHLSHWQWSQVGIGLILILILTLLLNFLQKLRLRMGLGFPELPP